MSLSLDDSSCENNTVTLIAAGGEKFSVARSAVKYSETLASAFTSDSETELQLSVEAPMLEIVCKWLELLDGGHKPDIKQPLVNAKGIKDSADSATVKFMCEIAGCEDPEKTMLSKNKATLYSLITTANYLMIDTLFQSTAAYIASMVKSCPRDQLAELLKP
jgi:hypothetical protein